MLWKRLFFPLLHIFCCIYGEKKPLYFGVLLELSESWYQKYTNFFPTMFEYAFQRIYNNADILADYEFKLVIRDTKGQPGLAARRLTEMLEEDPPKVAVIGPTLSKSLTVTGQIVPFYNVIEESILEEKIEFPYTIVWKKIWPGEMSNVTRYDMSAVYVLIQFSQLQPIYTLLVHFVCTAMVYTSLLVTVLN